MTATLDRRAPAVKPPYRVPTMRQIEAVPDSGLRVASTFAGAGGSSTGYRMAGFRVLWASEFIPAAADTYAANKAPETVLDRRDIRTVSGAEILAASGLDVGQLDVLDGSPPCASFSTAGRREADWGKIRKYSDGAQRTDDLFGEFARVLTEVQPKVFVAENVTGLVKGTAKGYFKMIFRSLAAAGYRVQARKLDASWLGVPQARQRIIFIGVRNDLGRDPVYPSPLRYQYTVRDVLPAIAYQGNPDGFGRDSARYSRADRPSGTLGTHSNFGNGRSPSGTVIATGPTTCPETGAPLVADRRASVPPGHALRRLSIPEVRILCGFPADFVLTGSYAQRWERLGRAVPPVMMAAIATAIRDAGLAS